MRGRGQFVADRGMREVGFFAHAQLSGVTIPDAHRKNVFAHRDFGGVRPIRAVSGLRGVKPSDQTPLASDKVRYVGEPVAMRIASARAQAEDIADTITLDLAELPAVHDMVAAREQSSALVHEQWGDSVFLETFVEVNISHALDAPIKVTREIRTARQGMAPIEGASRCSFPLAAPSCQPSSMMRGTFTDSAAVTAALVGCCQLQEQTTSPSCRNCRSQPALSFALHLNLPTDTNRQQRRAVAAGPYPCCGGCLSL